MNIWCIIQLIHCAWTILKPLRIISKPFFPKDFDSLDRIESFSESTFGWDKKKEQSYPNRIEMEPLKRFTQCGSLTMLFAVFIVLFGVSSTALTTFGKSPNPPPPPPTLPPGWFEFKHPHPFYWLFSLLFRFY